MISFGKLVMMLNKSAGDARPKIHPFVHAYGNQRRPIQSRLQSVLGVRSSCVERKNLHLLSNNQILRSAFYDLDPRLSLLCQVGDDVIHPCKICGGCQIRDKVHPYYLDSNLHQDCVLPTSNAISGLTRIKVHRAQYYWAQSFKTRLRSSWVNANFDRKDS